MKHITKTTLHERGQITIPSKAREYLHIEPGEELLVIVMEKEIILRPEIENPVEKAGMLGKDNEAKTVKELVARYRGFK